MKNIKIITFSSQGVETAKVIARALGGEIFAPEKFLTEGVTLYQGIDKSSAEALFTTADALVFVCACGIAVRTIAPFVKDKTTDPAVVVLDDTGKNVISLLSGHIGGANKLACRIAEITGGNPIVTTATDVHNLTAVDEWAKENNCAIENIKAAKEVSSEILQGHRVGVAITEETIPAPFPVTLWLRPKTLVLGAGCKKDIDSEYVINSMKDFMKKNGLSPLSIKAVASIELKKDEKALNDLAAHLEVPFVTYTAEELSEAQGDFSSSKRVFEVTGVDNVCERAAVLCSGGELEIKKTLYKGVTFALAKIRRQSCR